jgi:tetratricopeptide (TPR) repeat protein
VEIVRPVAGPFNSLGNHVFKPGAAGHNPPEMRARLTPRAGSNTAKNRSDTSHFPAIRIECSALLAPDSPATQYNLAVALYSLKRYKEAAEHYARAIQLRPNYAEAYNNLGVLLSETGRDRRAADCFARAAALKPGYAQAVYNLGVTNVKLKKREASMRQLTELRNLDAELAERLYRTIFSDKVIDARSFAGAAGVKQ